MSHTGSMVAVIATTCAIAVRVAAADPEPHPPRFQIDRTPPSAGAEPARDTAAYLAGGRIASLPDGGALVIDADSGMLIRASAAMTATDTLAIGRDAGLLVYDDTTRTAYVTDRHHDRIVAVTISDHLIRSTSWNAPREPYGIALTPDRQTIVVTALADRAVVAYDRTGKERWRVAVDAEPRGIAVSPDGSRALVAHAMTNVVTEIALAEHMADRIAVCCGAIRGGFAVAFMGDHQAVVGVQRSVPVAMVGHTESTGRYGGSSFVPPVSYHLAFVGMTGAQPQIVTARIAQHQPRALAWDRTHDALYIAGLGDGSVLQLVHASQLDIGKGFTTQLGAGCGPDGLAIARDGQLLVWCSFARSVMRVRGDGSVARGTELVASAYTPDQHAGMIEFHAATREVSQFGAVACSSCHINGRADGLSWRIGGRELQTPVLAGRLVGTAPYRWDGSSPDLAASVGDTVKRLGGTGLDAARTAALVAYLDALAPVQAPTRDPAAVDRGKAQFGALGCARCHIGAISSDGLRHPVTGTLREVDTPSLRALAASAPFFHDGSAPTLDAVLRDRGAVHGMTPMAISDDAVRADVIAFLESL